MVSIINELNKFWWRCRRNSEIHRNEVVWWVSSANSM